MTFSKKERELLKQLETREPYWFNSNILGVKEPTWDPSKEEYSLFNKRYKEFQKRKNNYYRQLKVRINKKVKKMESDLELYYKCCKFKL